VGHRWQKSEIRNKSKIPKLKIGNSAVVWLFGVVLLGISYFPGLNLFRISGFGFGSLAFAEAIAINP
jgi:uncharacterized membrane protein